MARIEASAYCVVTPISGDGHAGIPFRVHADDVVLYLQFLKFSGLSASVEWFA